MTEQIPAYGLWSLVVINSAVFILFAFSFFKPRTARDWRTFGAFSAFLVALFTEMYGFPLTVFLMSGWLQSRYPEVNLLSHEAGHLWSTVFGLEGDLLSGIMIGGGFVLLARAWKVLFAAQRARVLATTGPYAWVRHPQYVAFIAIMVGFLLQWPTLPTILMLPVLVFIYVRLARREEGEALREFNEDYRRYAASVPAFVPRPGHPAEGPA